MVRAPKQFDVDRHPKPFGDILLRSGQSNGDRLSGCFFASLEDANNKDCTALHAVRPISP